MKTIATVTRVLAGERGQQLRYWKALGCISMAAVLAAVAGSASAFAASPGSVHRGPHYMKLRPAQRKPAGAASGYGNLLYNGGTVETSPAVYIVWWGPEWASGFSTGGYSSFSAQQYLTDFFSNVGGSPWNNSVTQYCEWTAYGADNCNYGGVQYISNPGGQLHGTWNDTTPVPQSPTDADVANAALRAVSYFGYDPNATYMIFTPSGKSTSGFGTQWCAYHSSTSSAYGTVAYANMPYVPDAGYSCGMNFVNGDDGYGHGYFDGFSIVGGHEYAEAETDNAPSSGWVDASGAENGDKCAWDAATSDQWFGPQYFAVQPLWSNASASCVLSY